MRLAVSNSFASTVLRVKGYAGFSAGGGKIGGEIFGGGGGFFFRGFFFWAQKCSWDGAQATFLLFQCCGAWPSLSKSLSASTLKCG